MCICKAKVPVVSPKGHTDTIGAQLLSYLGCAQDSKEENSKVPAFEFTCAEDVVSAHHTSTVESLAYGFVNQNRSSFLNMF